MTKQELKVLTGLINQNKLEFDINTPDHKVLRAVTYNQALKDIIELLGYYQEGIIDSEVIAQLTGE